ncbi:hypothetical protein RFI_31033 [Reticulomyxa filosa]|uniref:Uncharacterized protein n=1 Tax=Reticulomyxa filosa TaxID=46433 RepID=X6LXP4_RETFI|nr:hypothetical protein RFI_31033 [Reticulomyxa filosa]|eukprot:ETO06364.1 hypothetical protein RFI_31033 [Reticulomyxa filosa]
MSLEKHATFMRQRSARASAGVSGHVNDVDDDDGGNDNVQHNKQMSTMNERAKKTKKNTATSAINLFSAEMVYDGKHNNEEHKLPFEYGMSGDDVASPIHNEKHLRTASGSIYMSFAADKRVIRNDLLTRQHVMKMHYHLPRLCRLFIDLLLVLWIVLVGLVLMWQVSHLPQMLSVSYREHSQHSTNAFAPLLNQYCNANAVPEYNLDKTKSKLTSSLFVDSIFGTHYSTNIDHIEYYWLFFVVITWLVSHTLVFFCYYCCKSGCLIYRFRVFRVHGVDPALWFCCACCPCCTTCKTSPFSIAKDKKATRIQQSHLSHLDFTDKDKTKVLLANQGNGNSSVAEDTPENVFSQSKNGCYLCCCARWQNSYYSPPQSQHLTWFFDPSGS